MQLNKNLIAYILFLTTTNVFAIQQNNSTQLKLSNMREIAIGSHSYQENQQHQEYCNNVGGIDVTDQTKLLVSQGTLDAIICKITDLKKYAVVTNVSENLFNIPNGSWRAVAPNGRVNAGQYYAVAFGQWNDVSGSISLDAGVPVNNCSQHMEQSYFRGSTTLQMSVLCQDNRHGVSNNSFATACTNGSCASDYGIVNII